MWLKLGDTYQTRSSGHIVLLAIQFGSLIEETFQETLAVSWSDTLVTNLQAEWIYWEGKN